MDSWKTSFLLGWPIFRCYVGFLYHLRFFLFWMAYVQAFFSLGSIGAWFAVLEDKELYESRPDGAFSSQQAKKKHGDQPFCPSKMEKKWHCNFGAFLLGCPVFFGEVPPRLPRLSPRKKTPWEAMTLCFPDQRVVIHDGLALNFASPPSGCKASLGALG